MLPAGKLDELEPDSTSSRLSAVSIVGALYEGRLISSAHSEISKKRDHVFKQKKVGSKVHYFSYKLT